MHASAQLWEKSGRIAVMGEEMFKLRDRRGQLNVLGMTHEEIFTTLAIELASYRSCRRSGITSRPSSGTSPGPRAG